MDSCRQSGIDQTSMRVDMFFIILCWPTDTTNMDSSPTKKERQQTRKIGSGSPIKVTPSETASVTQRNTQSSPVLQQQPPTSNTPTITDNESKQIGVKPAAQTPDQKYSDTKVGTADIHSTILHEVDNKPILDEQANQDQQLSITEVKEDQKIQQVTSELEYTAEAEAVNKVEPTLQESGSKSFEETTTGVMKSDDQSVLTFKDELNTGINDYKTDYYYNVNPFTTMPMLQLSWMELYNELAKNMIHWSSYWFDLFYELWLPTGTRISRNIKG